MVITFRQKKMCEINDVDDLVNFVNEKRLYKNFLTFNEIYHDTIRHKINRTNELPYKQVKPFLSEFMGPMSNRNLMYWLCRGFSESESIVKIRELQSKSGKNVDYEKRLLPSNTEYWVKKGFDLEESKVKVKDHQTTFSKEICIKKYGEDGGLVRFNERQSKWISSLSKNTFNHDSSSVEFFIKKYGDSGLIEMLDKLSYTDNNKIILKEIIDNVKNKEDLLNYIEDNVVINTLLDVDFIFKSKIIQHILDDDYNNIKNYITNGLSIVKTKFSNYRFVNGFRFNSNGEYQIGKFLMDHGVDFEHDDYYPLGKYRYDFYLPKYDLYVEYFGLIKNVGWQNNKILSDYIDKMEKKVFYCNKNNYNLVHDTKPKNVINKLKKIIWK